MGAEDRLAAVAVGRRDQDLAVEAAGAQQRLVELVDVVGGGDHDHRPGVPLEAVELDQQLVQRLLALAGAAVAAAAAAGAADRVELVDEDHRAAGLARLLEEAADAGGAAADEHLDEARARGGEEVDAGLGGDRAGEHRLAGAGRAVEEDAARRPGRRASAKRSGSRSHSATSISSSLAASTPCTSSQRTGSVWLALTVSGLVEPIVLRISFRKTKQQDRHEEDPEDGVPVEEEFLDAGSAIGEVWRHKRDSPIAHPSKCAEFAKGRA